MRKLSHFKIGLFILACTAIALGALVWIGAARLFQHTRTYVSYFAETVEGLNPGADVSYLGVQVGKVTAVGIAPDGRLIQVLMEIRPEFRVDATKAVQLQMQVITGQRSLAIVTAPPDIAKVTPAITFPLKYPLIPSCRGEFSQVESALKDLYQRLSRLDLEGLVAEWRQTARNANVLLADKSILQTLDNVRKVSADLKALSDALSGPEKRREWQQGVTDLAAAAAAARQASESLAKQLQSLPPDAVGNLARRMDRAVAVGEQAVGSWDRQVDRSLVLLQQNLVQVNGILADLDRLVRSLQSEPNRLLTRPAPREPFRR